MKWTLSLNTNKGDKYEYRGIGEACSSCSFFQQLLNLIADEYICEAPVKSIFKLGIYQMSNGHDHAQHPTWFENKR